LKDIELDEDFRAEVKALNKEARHLIGHAIAEVQRCFGNPHIHSGIGVRKLRPRLYEARTDLGERLLFEDRDDALFFFKRGHHREIQKYLKSL
jgi:mRNA-degrading endonuclease RelE of RelBE toxin-antitoxin system